MLRSLLALSAYGVALAGNTQTCIVNTGGSCAVGSCAAWRGSTKCDAMRCFCTGGTCAGTDQACHPTSHADSPYSAVDSEGDGFYELQNARWPNYFIYVQVTGALRLSTDHDGDTSLFTINRPPSDGGEGGSNNAAKSYLILSQKWPKSSVTSVKSDDNVVPSCNGVDGGLGGAMPDPDILSLTVTLTRAPLDVQLEEMTAKGQQMVMLSSPRFPNYYFYVGKTSWTVATWDGDPGAGGYWYIKTRVGDKPLPKAMQDKMFNYAGKRCSAFCGKAEAKAHSSSTIHFAALAAVLAAVSWSTA